MGPAFSRKYATLLVSGTTAIQVPIVKRGVIDFAVGADWTPAAGDVKVSIDGGAAANITNLPTALAMGNTAYWIFVLTAAELTGKQIVVTIADSATKAIEDQCFLVETFGHASAMYQADLSAANLPANAVQVGGQTASAAGTVTFPGTIASPTNITAGTITTATNVTTVNGLASGVITATSIAANAITAAKIATDAIGADQLAADAVTEIQNGLTPPSAAVIADAVWDEARSGHVASGSFGEGVADVIGTVDANIIQINGAAATATAGALDANLTKINGTNIATPATAGILEVNVKNINNVAAATPGAAGGILIAGSNAATTLATFTVSGATAFTGAVTMPAGLAANIAGNLSGSVESVTGLTTTTIWATAVPGAFASGTAGKILGDSGGTLATISSGITTIGSGITTILAALGAITGSGANTLLGYFKAVLSKTATLPSDIGGTFSPTTDSQEALSEAVATAISDIGGISGGGGGGGITLIAGVVVTGTSTTTFTASGADLLAVSGAYNGQFLRFDDGALEGERRTILTSTYLAGVTTFTFASNQAFTVAPTTGDNFGIG